MFDLTIGILLAIISVLLILVVLRRKRQQPRDHAPEQKPITRRKKL